MLESDFSDQAKKSEHLVETPFAFATCPDAILTGVGELLFGHEGRWRIIDYKTDVNTTGVGASHQEQLKMYERALDSVAVGGTGSQIHSVRVQASTSRQAGE